MKVAFYSYKDVIPGLLGAWQQLADFSGQYDRESFEQVNAKCGSPLDITFLRAKLEASTAALAQGHEAVCLFVNDDANAEVMESF